MERAELLILKSELTNDPLNLGLTIEPADDEANANLLNEVRDSIRVFRASIPADEIKISPAELAALSEGHREWWKIEVQDGTVKPSVIKDGFYELFGSNTAARASFDSVATEPSSRAIQLLERYLTLTPSDVANARQAT